MGQYYYVINLDKKQYLHPHKCGDGLKLLEFGASGEGTMMLLALLLSDGSGEPKPWPHICTEDPCLGSWSGDRIVIAGDYANDDNFNEDFRPGAKKDKNLYILACDGHFEDVSDKAIEALRGQLWEGCRLAKIDTGQDGWRG